VRGWFKCSLSDLRAGTGREYSSVRTPYLRAPSRIF